MKKTFKCFGTIEKVEKQDDGTLIVKGIASTEAKDHDGEVVTAKAMRDALPDYMKFGNIREMHQIKAAGVAIGAEVNDAGETVVTAHIVDAEAVKKVEAGVYKGFSIGGKTTKRDPLNKSTITGIKLSEISLVDRPANPGAVFDVWKAEGDKPEAIDVDDEAANLAKAAAEKTVELAKAAEEAAEIEMTLTVDDLEKAVDGETEDAIEKRKFSAGQRKDAAKNGEAESDGSYPIKNASDLKNAVKAYDRSKDKAKTKAHIMARAAALGLTSSLPPDWKTSKKSEKGEDLKKGMYGVSQLASLLQTLMYLVSCSASEEASEGDDSEVPSKLHDAAHNLAQILLEMTAEEVAEMFESKEGSTIKYADQIVTMPGDTKLSKAIAFLKAAESGNLDGLAAVTGFTITKAEKVAPTGDDIAKAEGVDALSKACVDQVIAIAKALGLPEGGEMPLAKVEEAIKKAALYDALPEQPLGKLLSVDKKAEANLGAADDADTTMKKVAAEIDALPESERPVAIMKAIHAHGGLPVGTSLTTDAA